MEKIGKRDGAGLSEGHRNSQQSSDKALFEAIRAEIDLRNVATIASADASDLATAITLVNEIKDALNAASSAAKQFEK